MTGAEKLLRRVRLELARDPDFPAGSRERGYDFIAPLDESGRIVHEAWEELKDRCRVRRFWPGQADEVGHVVRRPSGQWSFHYDIHGDAARDRVRLPLFEPCFQSRGIRLDIGAGRRVAYVLRCIRSRNRLN